jgi:hypothetical protein
MQAAHRTEIPGMLATLCSYEGFFGPYHPQTLSLMAQVGIAYLTAGEVEQARPLLEKVVQDAGQTLGREHGVRMKAIEALRDVFLAQGDYRRAAVVQREILECQVQRFGPEHAETMAARGRLAMILFDTTGCDLAKEA